MNTRERFLSSTPHAGRGAAVAASALRYDARRDLAAAAGGLLALALAAAWAADLGAAYVVKVLVWFAAGAALVWHGLRAGAHPHVRLGAANRVTLVRFSLAGLLFALLGEEVWASAWAAAGAIKVNALAWAVVALAMLTAALDAVDGALARRSGLASDFGARFDMETDAAYTLVLCALVWHAGQAGPWVLAAGLLRYGFVAAAWRWRWLAAPLPSSRRRQTVCVVQITGLIVCLVPLVPPALAAALAAASLALLGLSFAIDVHTLAQARHPRPEN